MPFASISLAFLKIEYSGRFALKKKTEAFCTEMGNRTMKQQSLTCSARGAHTCEKCHFAISARQPFSGFWEFKFDTSFFFFWFTTQTMWWLETRKAEITWSKVCLSHAAAWDPVAIAGHQGGACKSGNRFFQCLLEWLLSCILSEVSTSKISYNSNHEAYIPLAMGIELHRHATTNMMRISKFKLMKLFGWSWPILKLAIALSHWT